MLTHAKVARALDVPATLVEFAADQGLVRSVSKQGQWVMFDPADLPEREPMIAAVRERYRQMLREVDQTANALIAEFEAVQDDARDMLEHYTDPVGEFGSDLASIVEYRPVTPLRKHEDRLRSQVLRLAVLHRSLYQLDHPPGEEDLDSAIPVRARRSERANGPG